MLKHKAFFSLPSTLLILCFSMAYSIDSFAAKNNTPKCEKIRSQYSTVTQNLIQLQSRAISSRNPLIKSKISKANKDLKNLQRSYNSLQCSKILGLSIGQTAPVAPVVDNTPPVSTPPAAAPTPPSNTPATPNSGASTFTFIYEVTMQFSGDETQGGTVSCTMPKVVGVYTTPPTSTNFTPTLSCGAPLSLNAEQFRDIHKPTRSDRKFANEYFDISKKNCTISLSIISNFVTPRIVCN